MFSALRSKLSFLILILVMMPLALSVTAQDGSVKLLSFNVSYGGRTYDSAANQTTFTYVVTGVDQRPDLSHFDVGILSCTPPLLIVATSPTDAVSFGVDPTTGVDGIKWDSPLKTTESRTYSVSFMGNVAEGSVQVAVKADSFEIGSLPGPSCVTASIDVDKFISTDGLTWDDADDAPGPQVDEGTQVWFSFVISNIGNVELSDIALSDNLYDTSSCALSSTLAVGTHTDCVIGPIDAADGQHTNIATASGVFEGVTVSATDNANYFSGNLPQIAVEKLVSKNGGEVWKDSIKVRSGRQVWFKFTISNLGNVELTSLALTDSAFDTSSCSLPAALQPGASSECVIGPFPVGDSDHTNTATVSAAFEDQTVTASDTASYTLTTNDEDDDAVVIIIEGPIEAININIITIFGMNIEIDPNDPILSNIKIGDVIRVEGNMVGTGTTIIIVAITIIIINVDIIIVGPPSAPIFVPHGCKITGIGNNNPHLKCSKKSSKKSS